MNLTRLAVLITTLTPLIYLLYILRLHAIDMPFYDQWHFASIIDHAKTGSLTFHDFWAPNNEHRILFPKILMLTVALASGWNLNFEIAISVLIGIGIFFELIYLINKLYKDLKIPFPFWFIPTTSLFVFSLSQWENWFLGWQLQIFLMVFSTIGGFIALSTKPLRPKHIITAILSGLVASYSFATGLLFWPIGLFLLLANNNVTKKLRLNFSLIWILISTTVAFAYFYNLQKPPHHPTLLAGLYDPLTFLRYVLSYIGSPIVLHDMHFSQIIGFTGLIIYTLIIIKFPKKIDTSILHPIFALTTFALANALITALGRSGFGADQALSSRYITISQLFWISLVFLVHIFFTSKSRNNTEKKLALLIFIYLILFVIANSFYGAQIAAHFSIKLSIIKNKLQTNATLDESDPIYNKLSSHTSEVYEGLKTIKKYDLSIYRK